MMESGLWFSSASPLLSYQQGEVVALAGSSIAAAIVKLQIVTARFTSSRRSCWRREWRQTGRR